MATIKVFIDPPRKKDKKAKVRFRLSDGRKIQLYYKSEIEVLSDNWDSKNETIKAKIVYKAEERTAFNKSITDRKNAILTVYDSQPDKSAVTSKWLTQKLDEHLHPEKYNLVTEIKPDFFPQPETEISLPDILNELGLGCGKQVRGITVLERQFSPDPFGSITNFNCSDIHADLVLYRAVPLVGHDI